MLFFSFFTTLIGKPNLTVELKNGVILTGTLHSVDQFLNIKLSPVSVVDGDEYPHLLGVTSVFIRGSVVRYVGLPKEAVDTELLQDATRRTVREHRSVGGE